MKIPRRERSHRLIWTQSKKRKTTTAAESDSDDTPLIAKAKANGKVVQLPPRVSAHQIGEESDSDVPLGQKLAKQKQEIEKAAEKEAKQIRKEEKQEAEKIPKPKKAVPAKRVKQEESSDDDVPLAKRAPIAKKAKIDASKPTKKVKPKTASPTKKPTGKSKATKKEESADPEDEEDEDEEVNWWDDPTKGDGTNKWDTLQHNGVVFPPPYKPLPKNVKMKYDGQPVTLHPDA